MNGASPEGGGHRAPRLLNLFCGAGGLAEGFRQAGFEVVGGLDLDPVPLATFRRNHPDARIFCGDVRQVPSRDLAAVGPIDVLAGGPSCQGFSTHGKRIAQDPRNFLFREFVRVARDLRPPWVVVENVKGMLTYDKGAFRRRIHEAFEDLGYRIESQLLLAADFGVPQMRERIVFIGTLTDAPLLFPAPTHGPSGFEPWTSVWEAIGGLPRLGTGGGSPSSPYLAPPVSDYEAAMRRGSAELTLHEARPVSQHALSVIRRIPQGSGIRHLPEEELPARFRRMRTISTGKLRRDCTTLYHRLAWERPAYTITCYFRNVSAGPFVHPEDDRALTPREAARLQSFPDAYHFEAPSVPRQIGNAVPPLLAKAVAILLRPVISGDAPSEPSTARMPQLAMA